MRNGLPNLLYTNHQMHQQQGLKKCKQKFVNKGLYNLKSEKVEYLQRSAELIGSK